MPLRNNLEFASLEPSVKHYSVPNLLAEVDALRLAYRNKGTLNNQKAMAQFLTPALVAELMAGLFQNLDRPEISLLDAGAGIGSLLAAVVERIGSHAASPRKLSIVAYEIDRQLLPTLDRTLTRCQEACDFKGIDFTYEIRHRDFIEDAVTILAPSLLERPRSESFTHAILNPPYAKIGSSSKTRQRLQRIGLETTNIYTGFLTAAALLLEPEGEMVSITPRSFCNGTYFRPFRKLFLDLMSLCQIHVFESRSRVFRDDAVLQETIVLHARKQDIKNETVRRQTVHQFLDAALILMNPDNPERPINSPKTVYQIEESALKLIRKYGTTQWTKRLRVYLNSVETLRQKYAQEREMARIPVVIEGQERTLSPGGQNILVKKILEEFAPRFTPGGRLIYVGDTGEKFAYFAEDALADLGVTVDSHGKMPDAIVLFPEKNWLI